MAVLFSVFGIIFSKRSQNCTTHSAEEAMASLVASETASGCATHGS